MNKLLKWHDAYTLKILVAFLIIFTALYPKLPSVHIVRTWVYIRLEDFFILATVIIWFIQLLRHKVSIPRWLAGAVMGYWAVGLTSVIFSLLFIVPHLPNVFPHLEVLAYLRRIEYMILFFVAFSTIKSYKDVRDYFVILSITLLGTFLYGFGQKYYLYLWEAYPKFFEKYPFCFPSFQTGNEEFAKGMALCLPKDARINATFAGHYDLAAYLVLVIPIFMAVFITLKKWYWKLATFSLYISGLLLLLFTASRTSYMAYLIGAIFTLIIYKKKWYILPVLGISIFLLFAFSGSTAQRLLDTIRISSIVTNSQGQLVGEALPQNLKDKISKDGIEGPPPAQALPKGSAYLGLPQSAPVATSVAMVKKTLTPEEAKRLQLADGSLQLSTVSGTFLVKKVLVYDISFTTRLQAEWPNAWNAFMRNPLLGSGYSTITLATDNDYFRALGETGLLGLFSFILIFIIFGIAFRELIPGVQSPITRGFLFGLAGGFVGLALNAILIDVFEASKVAEALWILLGIGAGGLFLGKHKTVPYLARLQAIFLSRTAYVLYLLFIVLAAFLSSVGNFFVADDFTWLYWAATSSTTDIITYFTNSQGFFYRPLDKTIVYFLYTLFSFQPEGYHVFTIFLHFLSVVAVFVLGLRLFKNRMLGFLSAVIFALTPVHGENIFWFSTISTTLASVFILYAMIAFLNFRQKKHPVLWYILAVILSILAFLSYEIALVLPLLFILVDLFFIHPKNNAKTVITYLPFIVLIPLYYLVRHLTQAFSGGGDYSYSLENLIPNVFGNMFGYIGLFLFGNSFVSFYDMLRVTLRDNMVLFAIVFIVILVLLWLLFSFMKKKLKTLRKDPLVIIAYFGVVFALIALLPFLGLGNISERYLYLASVGLSLSLIAFLSLLTTLIPKKHANKRTVLLLVIVAALGIWYHTELGQKQAKWAKAGNITKEVLFTFRVNYESLNPLHYLYFVNTPMKHDGVWVYPVGLRHSLWFIYREKTPQVFQVGSVGEANDAIKARGSAHSSLIFIFDKDGNMKQLKK